MKELATITPEDKESLAQFLGSKRIPFQTRSQTDPSGLELIEFLVADDDWENACNEVEQWMALAQEQAEKNERNRCPTCSSPHVEAAAVNEAETLTMVDVVYTCKDCGRIFTTNRRGQSIGGRHW